MMSDDSVLNPQVAAFVQESESNFDDIPEDRKAQLEKIALYVRKRIHEKRDVRLTFICTHNSRRSHMAQVWAEAAAAYYGVQNVSTFSGGTEATAFNPRAVAALQRAGFAIDKTDAGQNPVYEVRFGENAPVVKAYSKVYHAEPNPSEDFCAVMTCSQADENCPVVVGASMRVAIPYDDPKDFDDTDQEAGQYDERCRQISCEMLYLFRLAGRDS
jgi:protein-tyrosine phosphatase/arsenate reductase